MTLLVREQQGYRNLCKLLTAAARGRPKGDARVNESLLAEYAAGLHCLTGGEEGWLAHSLSQQGLESSQKVIDRLASLFKGNLHIELQRHHLRSEEQRNQALLALADMDVLFRDLPRALDAAIDLSEEL